MIEQDAGASEQVVALAIIDGDVVPEYFRHAVGAARIERRHLGLRHFADAAVKGATASEKLQSDDKDRTRSRSRKDISGAAARSAALRILGLSPAAPKPAPDPVPEPVKQRGRRGVGAAPSENGHAADGAKSE